MRIVRPGSVVGPQQQYMYLKQLEWTKWAAVDEMKRQQAVAAAETTPAPAIVTPATPPADTDEDLPRIVTPPPVDLSALPPVTPSKHVAAATAKAKAIATPGQPRKTPSMKRMASESEDEEDDVLPMMESSRPKVKHARTTGPKGPSASEQRPSRVTRSTAGTARRTPAAPASPSKSGQGPNKIPRLATTKTPGAAKAVVAAQGGSRKAAPPPTPSRLPTLVSKRTATQNSLNEVAVAATLNKGSQSSDAWMTTNVAAVVVPGSKSQRAGLRPVRRRRSSFSSADVIV